MCFCVVQHFKIKKPGHTGDDVLRQPIPYTKIINYNNKNDKILYLDI